jgi:Ca-activated chloride channel homolog
MKSSGLIARRILGAAAAAALIVVPPGAPVVRAATQQAPIRVEVDLVNILASVTDPQSRPVPNLPQDAFQVYDDGVLQKISIFESETHLPLDIALMIDSSMSTKIDFPLQKEAAARFIAQVLRPTDSLSVYAFDDNVHQLADFSSDVPRLQQSVRRMKQGAGTAMYDAVVLGSQSLSKRKVDRRRVVVLVTDAGEDTSKADYDRARDAAIRSGALMYSVILRPIKSESARNTAGEHALATITQQTGCNLFSD